MCRKKLSSIPAILQKHWRTITQDPRLKAILPVIPLEPYKVQKIHSSFLTPIKKSPQVEISVLNWDEMVFIGSTFWYISASIASGFDPNWCQWLHILIQIRVNGSRIWSKSASMALDSSPIGHCGAIDADFYQILEQLTRIWIKMWSQWRRLGSNSGAIYADMDQNYNLVIFWGLNNLNEFF